MNTQKFPEIGDYIRFWENEPAGRKSYGGTVIKEHIDWTCYVSVFCVDGAIRILCLTTTIGKDGNVKYKPEYINYGKKIGER